MNKGSAPTKADKTSWTTYKPTSTVNDGNPDLHKYWTWKTAGKTTFMPTFNKNKDSLKADINGTYEKKYQDYKTYTVGQKLTQEAEYDNDDNDVEDSGIDKVSEEHTAKETQTAEVITMAEWKTTKNQAPGKYWIYDTDGWAYWGEALAPGEATGLLLDSIAMTNEGKRAIPGKWYYGINVVAQFATTDDIGSKEAVDHKGFYDTAKGTVPSEDAELLLGKLKTTVVNANALDKDLSDKVRAAVQTDTQGDTTKVVNIDNTDFYVLKVNKNEALLLAKNVEDQTRAFNANNTNHWSGSEMQNYLNGEWLNGKATLKKAVKEHTLYTRAEYNSPNTDNAVVTKDKVFLLSQADVYGTVNNGSSDVVTSDIKDYTLGKAEKILPETLKIAKDSHSTAKWWWLRSPRDVSYYMTLVITNGGVNGLSANNTGGSVRPALVINLTPGA